jgi:hypothetical protein
MNPDKKFNYTLKEILNKNTTTDDKVLKAKYAIELFDFVVVNKEIFDRPVYNNLREILLNKLKFFKQYNSDIIDTDKYFKILYPGAYESIPTLNDMNNVCDKLIDIQNNNPNATIQEINEHMGIKLEESPIIIDNYLPTHDYGNQVDFIFDDYELHKITSKNTYFDMNFKNAVVHEIGKKYIACDKNIVLSMLNANKTIDEIKNDCTYDGPFLIKLSDYMYELYEKETKIERKTGYFYVTNTSIVTIHKIGKYCVM